LDRKYEITVPVTHYEKIRLTPNQIIEVLQQEMKALIDSPWDGICMRDGY
jgi:hypothetical protein